MERSPEKNSLPDYINELLHEKPSLSVDVQESKAAKTAAINQETSNGISNTKNSDVMNTEKVVEDVNVISENESVMKSPNSTQSQSSIKAEPVSTMLDEADANKDDAIYEQHKQRLEKMLNQMNTLDEQKKAEFSGQTDTQAQLEQVVETVGDNTLTKASEIIAEVIEDAPYIPPSVLSSEWLPNGRPHWAQQRFEIMLIEVNGLKLAVPLVALGQINLLDQQMTSLFGQSDWFMGLQTTAVGKVKTVNTAKFVMPERYQDDHDYQYVVSINGLDWGLAVDTIDQPISIEPDAIRWRKQPNNRPWRAGMLKDHMCVLLDIPVIWEILQDKAKNHSPPTGT